MPHRYLFKSNEEYNEWHRNYRAKNINKIRKYKRKYNKAWRKKFGYSAEQRAKKKFPEKEKARHVLYRAISKGKIIRATKCSKCNCKKRIEAHHEDYTKPLEIIWLCKLHHVEADRLLREKLDKTTIPSSIINSPV